MRDCIDIVAPKPAGAPPEIVIEEVPAAIAPSTEPIITESQLDELDQLYMDSSDEEEDEPPPPVEDVLDLAERVALSDFHPWDLIAMSFDQAWDYIDELMDEEWDDATEENKKGKANLLRKLALDANRSETRALQGGPVFSEYQHVIFHVIPAMVEKNGKLLLRCNEQGQESLGALLKRMLKNGVNKRRKVGKYVLKGSKPRRGCEGPANLDKVFDFKNTATKESFAMLSLKVHANHDVTSRLTKKKRMGQAQKAVRLRGEMLKKERVPTLGAEIGETSQLAVSTERGNVYENIQLDPQEH